MNYARFLVSMEKSKRSVKPQTEVITNLLNFMTLELQTLLLMRLNRSDIAGKQLSLSQAVLEVQDEALGYSYLQSC
ncbi:hypothetical protein L3X38_004654 [Prunus dulcis]|uniref:Uncharacterized protein n=1 Tax=Prunus dulcis TaxID=3755 RepID=A0AAD4ZPD2_PRUDU|nr:hypothetical protein L3X38_004654 [Prunus dulcis]